MPIDPSVIMQARPAQLQQADPMDTYTKSLTLQHLMKQGDLQDLQTQQARKAITDDDAVSAAYQQSGGDPTVLRALLAKGGQYKAVQSVDKFLLESEKTRTGIDKDKAQTGLYSQQALDKALTTHRDQLANVNDPQAAAQWVTAGYNDPVLGQIAQRAGSLESIIAKIPTDPAAFQQWKQQSALGATKFIELNKPNVHYANTGGTTQAISTPGLGGAPSVIGSLLNTQSPDSVASNATTQRGQNMTQATTVRGQDITDKRERDVGLSGQKAQAGAYGREIGEAGAQAKINLPTVTAQAERGLKLIDDLIGTRGKTLAPGEKSVEPHPGFDGAIGISGIGSGFGAAGFIPGTDTKDFKKRLDEIKGGAFMQAFQSLRGGGAITEKEGEKATAAITRMDTAQSEKEFVTAAREFQDVIRNGVEKAKRQATIGTQGGGAGATQSDIDAELRRRGVIK